MRIVVYFVFYYLFLFYYASNLNIGDLEVDYLSHNYPITYIQDIFFYLFGKSNFILRLPSLILSMVSICLYYQISKKYLKQQQDIYFSVVIFSLMPGFIIASLLFNKSIYIIFLVLLFIYSFFYYRFYSYILLFLYTITDYSFISLYIGLIFYSIYKKDSKFLVYSIFLFGINANYFNYEIKGHPVGHLIDVLGVYFAIFSPFVFLYFIYSLLKIKKPTLLWFISSWGLLFSIILSFRQKIKIDDYAPFVIIAVVFMINIFFSDYRIRLKVFRKPYKLLFLFLLSSLILFDCLILVSKKFLDLKIVNQFKYSKEIVIHLKQKNIDKVFCNNQMFCKKLYFYGLKKGKIFYIKWEKKDKKVSISHNHKKLYSFYVSKLNKN